MVPEGTDAARRIFVGVGEAAGGQRASPARPGGREVVRFSTDGREGNVRGVVNAGKQHIYAL